ncbi:hypothetical protein CQ12_38015 [Bradyrhizobium jicamae]|uniref:Uncharacterized protein n=2 Tax=Bradyrhizobium jicamae TaxID=280332 RepID=A0A0R3KV76_9BRAD|nr:hypothetical protein CQ12_38015 [Bradyrhizobium jicamae]
MGVAGKDPVGHKIGSYAAKRFPLGQNWYPADVFKQTLCGTFHHFNFYDGAGAEADWNNYFLPSPRFAFLRDDLLPQADPDDVHKCDGVACMEAEITPDEHFYNNPWFPKDVGSSAWEGSQMCTYGPWVWEEAHGNRPEIHPSELYWWKEPWPQSWGGGDIVWMMLLQDDSNRFDREGDYGEPTPRPSWWRPWSKNPRTGQFKIAFTAPPRPSFVFGPLNITINEAFSRNVVTSEDEEARRDSDDGAEHALEYNGTVVVQVRELQARNDDVGVQFVDLCRRPNGWLQGYVALTSKVGRGDRGQEGYHVLNAHIARQSRLLPDVQVSELLGTSLRRSARETVLTKADRASLRRAMVNGRPQLTMDVRVGLIGDGKESEAPVSKIELIEGGSRSTLAHRLTSDLNNRSTAIARGVPVLGGAKLSVLAGAEWREVTVPPFDLAPRRETQKPTVGSEDSSAWMSFLSWAGGRKVEPGGLSLMRAAEWEISVDPQYAPIREGKPSAEDDSPPSEELNSILMSRDAARLKDLFGAEQPFQVQWTFEATNVVTGQSAPVRVGGTGDSEIGITRLPSAIPDNRLNVRFPSKPDGALYELIATATMIDTFGMKGSIQHRVASHVVTGRPGGNLAESLASAAASMADADPDALAKGRLDVSADDKLLENDPRARRARLVRLVALRATEDDHVTVDELRRVVQAAKLLSAQ